MNGQITKVTFYSFGGLNSLPAVTSASLAFRVDSRLLSPIAAGLKNDPLQTQIGPSELQFTPVPSVTAVPLPGALPLFATTVAALAYVARRKRKVICAQSVA